MTEVLHSPSPSSSPSISNATLLQDDVLTVGDVVEEEQNREKRESDRREQLSLLALLVALFRKSFWLNCKTDRDDYGCASTSGGMEIGWPTDVEHVNHVTFDRFDGFLGLPVEFEPEVPRRAPSARYTDVCFRRFLLSVVSVSMYCILLSVVFYMFSGVMLLLSTFLVICGV